MFARNLTIVIPTMGRADLLMTNVQNLSKGRFAGTLIIADSSPKDDYQVSHARLQDLEVSFTVHHLHTPGQDVFDATSAAGALITSSFTIWCADDDLLVPETLDQCCRYLDDNHDYSAAFGKSLIIALSDKGVEHVGPYVIQAYNNDASPSGRLLALFSNYSVVHFSVVRTEVFQRCLAPVAPKLGDRFLGIENLWNALYVLYGKTKIIDELSLVRVNHAGRQQWPTMLDQLMTGEWASSSREFINYVSAELVNTENCNAEWARNVVLQALSLYVSRALSDDACIAYGETRETGELTGIRCSGGLGNVVKSIPVLSVFLKAARARYRAYIGTPIVSLDELKKKTSPYHDVFKPIYDLIVDGTNED